jgi:hypothetical protein
MPEAERRTVGGITTYSYQLYIFANKNPWFMFNPVASCGIQPFTFLALYGYLKR